MARLQQFEIIRHENTQLKALLSVSSSAKMQSMVADILAVETSPARQLIVINKGSREGVVTGLPVLDSQGVMGQIIDVGRMTSTVLLISDSKSAVPVRNERTGELGILIGKNNRSRLSLIHLPRTALMAPGDLLVTSGLGRRYPKGYPVGKVDVVKNSPGDDFMNVSVRPVALLNRDRLVLVIWPKDDQVAWMTDLDERMRVMDDKV